MMAERYPENATVLERLEWYSRNKCHQQGQALEKLADYLEGCFLWRIEFHAEDDDD